MKTQTSHTTLSKLMERFAFLQEAINFEIFKREANQGQLTEEEWIGYQREIAQIGDSEDSRDFDFDFISATQGQLAATRFEKEPSYKDWLREDYFANPADPMKKSNTTTHRKIALDIVKELQKIIPQKFKNVNTGGCAYFARFLYEEFKKMNINAQVEIMGFRSISMFGGYQHICLMVEGKSFDAEDCLDNELDRFLIDHLDYSRLSSMTSITDRENWNPQFSIDDRKNLKKELEDYFENKRRTLKSK